MHSGHSIVVCARVLQNAQRWTSSNILLLTAHVAFVFVQCIGLRNNKISVQRTVVKFPNSKQYFVNNFYAYSPNFVLQATGNKY